MVTEERLTREEPRELDRQRRIAQAVADGDPLLAEWLKTVEYDDEGTPEDDAEDIRIARERIARGSCISLEEVFAQDAELHPEEGELYRRLDAEFPEWPLFLSRIAPDSPEGIEFFARLEREFPEAVNFVRGVE